MPDSDKIVEALENLEVALTLVAESGKSLSTLADAIAADIVLLERATTARELFDQLIKMQKSGYVQQLATSSKEISYLFQDTVREVKKTTAVAGPAYSKALARARELLNLIEEQNKSDGQGDSWKEEE